MILLSILLQTAPLPQRTPRPRVMTPQTSNWAVLGSMQSADIEALAFLVLMQSAKSAQEDLKSIMAGVKAINAAKAKQRELLDEMQRLQATERGADGKVRLRDGDKPIVIEQREWGQRFVAACMRVPPEQREACLMRHLTQRIAVLRKRPTPN